MCGCGSASGNGTRRAPGAGLAVAKVVVNELADNSGSLLFEPGIRGIKEGGEFGTAFGVVLEGHKDVGKLVPAGCSERLVELGRVVAVGPGDIVQVMGQDDPSLSHAENELLSEDFVGGLEGQLGAADGVGRTGFGGERAGVDGDVPIESVGS